MTNEIIKPDSNVDFYVIWSNNSEQPLAWGTRDYILEELREEYAGGENAEMRLKRADAQGTSSMVGRHSWNEDEGWIWEQAGWAPRSRFRKTLMAWVDAGEDSRDPAVQALLEPLED